MKSAFLDTHFYMLFMFELYDHIRQGYKTKYVQYINFVHERAHMQNKLIEILYLSYNQG